AVSTLDDGQEWLDRIETGEDVVVAGGGYDASDGVAVAGVCVERGGVNCCPDSCGAVEHIRQSGALKEISPAGCEHPHIGADAGYACGMTAGTALDPALTRPLYTLAEAAAIVSVPPSTLHTWARGRSFKGIDGAQYWSDALIT